MSQDKFGLTDAGVAMNEAVLGRLQSHPQNPAVLKADTGDDFAWPPYLAEKKLIGDTKAIIITEEKYGVMMVITRIGDINPEQFPHLLSQVDEENGIVIITTSMTNEAAVLEALK